MTLIPKLDHDQRNAKVKDDTTREESEILERDKVVKADRTLFEPYFRHKYRRFGLCKVASKYMFGFRVA